MSQEKQKTIAITVTYVGTEPFVDEVSGNPTFEHIKRQAMRKFELELSAADNYVLQYMGTDVDDRRHIESLGQKTLVLVLALKKEPVKG